jgi:hypothetical protein
MAKISHPKTITPKWIRISGMKSPSICRFYIYLEFGSICHTLLGFRVPRPLGQLKGHPFRLSRVPLMSPIRAKLRVYFEALFSFHCCQPSAL